MSKSAAGMLLGALLTLGAGCTAPTLPSLSFLAKDIPATDVALAMGAVISLRETALGPLAIGGDAPVRNVTLNDWRSGDTVRVTWSESYERETLASVQARDEAERASGVGEVSQVPAPVYETVARSGSLWSDALDDGQRVLLPSAWPETEADLRGKDSTLIWLSRLQYDELSSTRHTHLEIGAIDAGLQDAAKVLDAIKGLVSKLQNNPSADAEAAVDITEIMADAEWGSYRLEYNGKKISVQTIQAENAFANYTILANPDNPLILKVSLKAWAYGTEALGIVTEDLQVAGYSVTAINSQE